MKRWFPYIKPYLAYFILGPICMIVEVIGEVLMPKLLSYIIDFGVYSGEAKTQVPRVIQWLYDVCGNNVFIVAVMVGMIMTAVIMMIGGLGGAYFGAKASVNFATDLRADVFRRIQSFSFANIDKFNSGSLITRLTNDVTQLQNFVNMLLRMFLRTPGIMIGALIMAIRLNPKLSVVLAIAVPLMLVSIGVIVFKGFPRFSRMQTKIDALNSVVGENLTNARVVKSFVREEFEKEKFGVANGNLKKAGGDAMRLMILMGPVMTLIMNVTMIAVYRLGGEMLYTGSMSTGDLTAFVTYITQILTSLMMVTFLFVVFSRAMASGKRIAEVLDEKIDVADTEFAERDRVVQKGSVEFRGVSCRYYKNSDGKVLDDINLKIEAGETVGIIGSTGCGKTTLVSLIARLYDADEGEVLVDGAPVKKYTLHNLRVGVGVVLQKIVLFSGSILHNLLFGNAHATESEVRAAAESAQADGFVSGFKEGYDTMLEQGGVNVSGGQKQRLCIARALLKKPKILILDDSTSAVDTATEKKIREAFAGDLEGTTKITLAQRIGSVKDADKIVVMNEGRITGVGTHDELLANNTEYKEIYDSQTDRGEASEHGSKNA
ncbi:MAG: ABC transporter ATP-binding protein [Clostridia bacterium]|nr:ABC transporter ATP-binding protein [Clostridia bacterium]